MNLTTSLVCRPVRLLALAGAALLSVSLSFAATTQEPGHPEKPLLWKIEGPGLERPSYLFATIHLGDKVVTTLHPAAQKAFDESTAFHAEVSLDPAAQMASTEVLKRKDGSTLRESIGAEAASDLDAELKRISPLLDATPFQQFKTYTLAVLLPQLEGTIKGEKPLDLILWERAQKAGKKSAGMQTSEAQLRAFDTLTEQEQIEVLSLTLGDLKEGRNQGESTVAKVRRAYLSGEPDRVAEIIQEVMVASKGPKELSDKLSKGLLHERDILIADYIGETVRKSPSSVHFFAAGAAHFCGKVSVITHLKNAGFTVTRIDG